MAERELEIARSLAEKAARKGGRCFFVGGYVRDVIRKRENENKDIDLEVHGLSCDQLRQILEEEGECLAVGTSFGVFTLKGCRLDVAMPRRERATGRGHRDFAVDVDPFLGTEKAAARRDFTMNALMQDVLTGEILDYFGGMEDIRNGIVRHVDRRSFTEDPLRVLRGCQFSARFGYEIAEETVALCREMDLSALPGERIMEELRKALMQAERPSVFFEQLRRMDALDVWFPELEALIGVPQDPLFHPEGDVWIHTMRALDAAALLRKQAARPLYFMLAALCHDLGKAAATRKIEGRIHAYGHDEMGVETAACFLRRITREKKLEEYVSSMVRLHMRPNMLVQQQASDKAFRKLFDLSEEPGDLLLLSKADYLASLGPENYCETERILREQLADYRRLMEMPWITAGDLMDAGLQPGPALGEALAFSRKLRLAGVSRQEALTQTLGTMRAAGKCPDREEKP